MPNARTPSALVETATKCLRDRLLVAQLPSGTRRAPRARWSSVSSVVKVFEQTMNSVSAGSRSRVASKKSVPSTLDTKRNVRSRWL